MYLIGVLFGALARAPVTFFNGAPVRKNVDKKGLDSTILKGKNDINSFKINSISLPQSEAFLFFNIQTAFYYINTFLLLQITTKRVNTL